MDANGWFPDVWHQLDEPVFGYQRQTFKDIAQVGVVIVAIELAALDQNADSLLDRSFVDILRRTRCS